MNPRIFVLVPRLESYTEVVWPNERSAQAWNDQADVWVMLSSGDRKWVLPEQSSDCRLVALGMGHADSGEQSLPESELDVELDVLRTDDEAILHRQLVECGVHMEDTLPSHINKVGMISLSWTILTDMQRDVAHDMGVTFIGGVDAGYW